MRRPALIFDFGNVVGFFDYTRACELLGKRLGLSGEELLELARSRGFGKVVESYEQGSIDSIQFAERVCGLIELTVSPEEFALAWSNIFWPNEPVGKLIQSLKAKGYSLILGSNTNEVHARQFKGQFAETLGYFDGLILSYEIGHLKPSTAFYLACAQAASASPDECLFIDDMPENVEGARLAGLQAIQYQEVAQLLEALSAHGVETPRIEELLDLA